MTAVAERTPPQNIEAEKAVLGALLVNNDVGLEIADRLQPADFYRAAHATIYGVMREMLAERVPIDLLTLKTRLASDGKLEKVGGVAYLASLVDGVPVSINATAYADIVKQRSVLRQVMAVGRAMVELSSEADADPTDVLDRAQRDILQVSMGAVKTDLVSTSAIAQEVWPALERILEQRAGVTGTRTGFVDLDRTTRGLQPANLVILAARPSMGKSALALNIATNVAQSGGTVGFFSLEMSRQEVAMRIVSALGSIDGQQLQAGYLPESRYPEVSDAMTRFANLDLWIDDTAQQTTFDIRSKARRLAAARGDLALIIVDYLQLIRPSGKAENRTLELAQMTRDLKALSKELKVPVMALSQLSRKPDERGDKRPQLSDLRESGAIEQDADVVILLYRPGAYEELRSAATERMTEAIIAKHRNGPTGVVRLVWSKEYTRFDNATRPERSRTGEDDD